VAGTHAGGNQMTKPTRLLITIGIAIGLAIQLVISL
jgi:hypothetical protein